MVNLGAKTFGRAMHSNSGWKEHAFQKTDGRTLDAKTRGKTMDPKWAARTLDLKRAETQVPIKSGYKTYLLICLPQHSGI